MKVIALSALWALIVSIVFAFSRKVPLAPISIQSVLRYWAVAFVAAGVPVVVTLLTKQIWQEENVQSILLAQMIVSLFVFTFIALPIVLKREVNKDPPPSAK